MLYLFAYDGDYHGNDYPGSLFLVDSSTLQVTFLLHLEKNELDNKLCRTEDGVRLFTREGCYFFSQDATRRMRLAAIFSRAFPAGSIIGYFPAGMGGL